MPSTDIDGSTVVILSQFEAELVMKMYECLERVGYANDYERALNNKIKRALGLTE